MLKNILVILCALICAISSFAQTTQGFEYTGIYDLLNELASDHIIDINPAVQPYTRKTIAQKLQQAAACDSLLSRRQREEIAFYCNEYALELDTLPHNWVQHTKPNIFGISLAQPQISVLCKDSLDAKHFTMSVRPVFGSIVDANRQGFQVEHHWGAEMQMDICNHLAIWGKIYDTHNGLRLKHDGQIINSHDWSQSTCGISLYSWFGSIGFQKEKIRMGNAQYQSIILSGNAPSFPMLTLKLTPVRWFEFNYFHAWLTPDAMDTIFSPADAGGSYIRKHKYMAANMFTFMPIPYLEFSLGNAIVYAENNIQAAYLIPFAFYKSLDHLLTKGSNTQNQNSMAFFTISTRNLKHMYVYGSLYIDEFKFDRLKPSNKESNPIAYQVGLTVTNWPVDGLRVKGEFMRSRIACYDNMVNALWYSTDEHLLGHPLGGNAQNIYAEIGYRPIRGLDIRFSYCNDTRYNQYHAYYRNGSIDQPSFKEKVWRNEMFELKVQYEIFNNCFALFSVRYNHARGYAPSSTPIDSEDRGQKTFKGPVLEGTELENYYLQKYSPILQQNKNWTITCGLYYNF